MSIKAKFPEAVQFSYNSKPFPSKDKAIEAVQEKNLRPGEPAQAYYLDEEGEIHSFLAIGSYQNNKAPLIIEGTEDELEEISKDLIGDTSISINPITGDNEGLNAPTLEDYEESGENITSVTDSLNYLVQKVNNINISNDWIDISTLLS